MKKFKNKYKTVKKEYIFFVLPLIFLILLGLISKVSIDKKVNDILIDEIKSNERRLVSIESEYIGSEFNMIISDLKYLHHAFEEKLLDVNNICDIAENWKVFSSEQKFYDQIRYIDELGNEKIRINLKEGVSAIVPKDELQNKKDRYYFYEGMELDYNDIYVSSLDLNIEQGVIEEPYKPMIRFATPIQDQNKNKKGVIILNYLASKSLKQFRLLAEDSIGEIVLLNSSGHWMSSESTELEWNFMFSNNENLSFKQRYPEEWDLINDNQQEFLTKNGMFFSKPIILESKIDLSNIETSGNRLYSHDSKWYVVSIIDNRKNIDVKINSNYLTFVINVFKKDIYYLSLVVAVSIIISYLLLLNRAKYVQVKHISEHDSLTKVFNRRAGLEKLESLILENHKKLNLSLCYVDVNGLKQVNDDLGHTYGDELIVIAISIIKSCIRENDFLIRMGGDEFLIVFYDANLEKSETVWQRIITQFNKLNSTKKYPFIISLSHGIVCYKNSEPININELIKQADKKMYEEKFEIKKRK